MPSDVFALMFSTLNIYKYEEYIECEGITCRLDDSCDRTSLRLTALRGYRDKLYSRFPRLCRKFLRVPTVALFILPVINVIMLCNKNMFSSLQNISL